MLPALFALLSVSAPPAAQAPTTPQPMLVEITEGQPVTIRQDRAYLLFRVHRPKGVPSFEPIFLRKPTPAELADYRAARAKAFEEARPKLIEEREKALQRRAEQERQGRKPSVSIPPEPSLDNFTYFYPAVANLAGIRHNFPLAKGVPDNLYLIEAIPGDYVLYGTSWGTGPQGLAVCWCLGTVGFTAKAGTVSDLGTMFFDTAKFRSKIPELKDETGFGPSSDTPWFLIGGTVRPDRRDGALPAVLSGVAISPADYFAVGSFVDLNNGGVNRLGPVPAVLDYVRGRPIDLKSGQPARGGATGR
ncbi:hypothetical protein J2Y54_000621 [Sphingomonas sp. BE123]|uniref:hypothetical protein n=1 Tax=Sphingomonas sp. BE123 TaxID=2817842 RepID=UPI0028593C05|nr:hypothetical protein [Sphingomonas sp. BE123]MDR6851128.1 hypothetical protein [Sphingomonas sp. BE123]